MLAALLLAATCLAQEPAVPPRPDVVLVTIDTLRREHLGCYGYPRPTSPRIDALAAGAVVFERAHATMATTFPSHLSMLTGLYPHQHGETSNRGAVREPYRSAPGKLSLSRALAEAGYRTAGFVSSVVLNERTGIGDGFSAYDGPAVAEGKRAAGATVAKALEWLAQVPTDQPFFLWVHLWDVHEPNEPEPAFAQALAVDDVLRTWLAGRALDVEALSRRFASDADVAVRFFGQAPRKPAPSERKRPPKFVRPQDARREARQAGPALVLDEEALLGLYARYDACVRQVDTEVGRLLDALAARGTWDRTAFVFTADHGQALGDGLVFGHGVDREINSRVPWILRLPPAAGIAPQRSSALVSLVDLAPTLLAHLGIPGLDDYRGQLVGQDVLAPGFARDGVFTAEATEFHRGGERPYTCALVSDHWKLVRSGEEASRLFDLAGAGEGVDVKAAHPEIAAELERRLATEFAGAFAGAADGASAPTDPEAEELLRQLGGLGYGGDDDE